jgi:hypothetical protein
MAHHKWKAALTSGSATDMLNLTMFQPTSRLESTSFAGTYSFGCLPGQWCSSPQCRVDGSRFSSGPRQQKPRNFSKSTWPAVIEYDITPCEDLKSLRSPEAWSQFVDACARCQKFQMVLSPRRWGRCHCNFSKLDCRVMIRLWTLIFSISHRDFGTSVLAHFLRHRIDICGCIQSLFVCRKTHPCWRYFDGDQIETGILEWLNWDHDRDCG